MKKKAKKGAKPGAKPQTKLEPVASFFNFFSPPEVPEDNADMDEEEMAELQDQLERDYDIGCVPCLRPSAYASSPATAIFSPRAAGSEVAVHSGVRSRSALCGSKFHSQSS